MESLPFALRVAAGVVAESIDLVRKLPTEISTLPVTVMGTLAKLSFQLNQELTDLASAGDRLLAGIRGGEEPPERTAWATIDDEDETARDDPQAAATWDSVADARDDEGRERVEPSDAAPVDSQDAAGYDDPGRPRPSSAKGRSTRDRACCVGRWRRQPRWCSRRPTNSPTRWWRT